MLFVSNSHQIRGKVNYRCRVEMELSRRAIGGRQWLTLMMQAAGESFVHGRSSIFALVPITTIPDGARSLIIWRLKDLLNYLDSFVCSQRWSSSPLIDSLRSLICPMPLPARVSHSTLRTPCPNQSAMCALQRGRKTKAHAPSASAWHILLGGLGQVIGGDLRPRRDVGTLEGRGHPSWRWDPGGKLEQAMREMGDWRWGRSSGGATAAARWSSRRLAIGGLGRKAMDGRRRRRSWATERCETMRVSRINYDLMRWFHTISNHDYK
jgi:hypothetical protein